MSYFIKYFKTDVIDGTFEMAKRIFRPVTLIYIVYFLIATLLSSWFAVTILEFDLVALQELKTFPEIKEFYEEYAATFQPDAGFLLGLVLVILVILLASSWFYQIGLRIADKNVHEEAVRLPELLRSSFNIKVIGLIAIALMVMVSYMVAAMIGTSIIMALKIELLALVVIIGILLVVLRFTIAPAAYVIGDMSIRESIVFSWKYITFFRALKLFGFGILLGLIFMVVFFLVSLLTVVFRAIPFLGQIVSYAVNVAFGGFLAGVVISAMVALYYRYLDIPQSVEIVDPDH